MLHDSPWIVNSEVRDFEPTKSSAAWNFLAPSTISLYHQCVLHTLSLGIYLLTQHPQARSFEGMTIPRSAEVIANLRDKQSTN
jgi:hypothetical protein